MAKAGTDRDHERPRIIGRSSSHFTRVLRIYAECCGIDYDFQVVPSLSSTDPDDYGGHPGLRLPSLQTAAGITFGSLPGCRRLAEISPQAPATLWPEQLPSPALVNAMELTTEAMAIEVGLIMRTVVGQADSPYAGKLRTGLEGMLAWLETAVDEILPLQPTGRLSYLDLSLFALIDHLDFREVLPLQPYPRLCAFRDRYAQQPAALKTCYVYDS